jgi:hypothetical protein
MLDCDWQHSVGQNQFFVMMHLNRDSAIQRSSRRFSTIYKSEKSDPLRPFGRRDIPSRCPIVQSFIRPNDENFRPDLPLCWEASNCSTLHPSRRFSSMSKRHSVFDQLWDFYPKHRYGKITATVRTMWSPVQTCSSIRQVAHSKFKLSDTSVHVPDVWATNMEIACIRSTVRTTIPVVQTREALIWKLRAAEVRPFRRQGNIVRMRLKSGKNFNKILECRSHNCPCRCLMSNVRTVPRFFKPNSHLNLQPINNGP